MTEAKKLLRLAVTFFCCLIVHAKEIRFLMIGNSYTRQHRLGEMVADMLNESDNVVSSAVAAKNGARFLDHSWDVQNPLEPLNEYLVSNAQPWDFVFMQEQSQIPALRDVSGEYSISTTSSKELVRYVRMTGAKVVFFLTWGRRDGDRQFFNLSPNFKTHQQRLLHGYEGYVDQNTNGDQIPLLAPVGLAFEYIYDLVVADGRDPASEGSEFHNLYSPDGSHASIQGAFLAACVLYGTISGRNPMELTFVPGGLTIAEAEFLQKAASSTLSAQGILTPEPTWAPTKRETFSPTTDFSTQNPSPQPTSRIPTASPTSQPVASPTVQPTTESPTMEPSALPITESPVDSPTINPSTPTPTIRPTSMLLVTTMAPTPGHPTVSPTTTAPTNSPILPFVSSTEDDVKAAFSSASISIVGSLWSALIIIILL